VRAYDTIYHEDLPTANLVKNHRLAKSLSAAGWRAFLTILSCKAADAGKAVVAGPLAFTSQACSGGGLIVQQGFSVRWHACPECGASLHRDQNAALNIVRLGREGRAGLALQALTQSAGTSVA
jgi:putative transposase